MGIEELEKALEDKYDVTEEAVPRSYLFPDGRFLALDAFRPHSGVEQRLIALGLADGKDPYNTAGGAPTIEDLGAIRINLLDEGFIMLSQIPPTQAQYESLERVLRLRMHEQWNWRYGIMIVEPHQKSDFKDFDVKGKEPDYVIGIIKHYYETGHLTEPMSETKNKTEKTSEFRPDSEFDVSDMTNDTHFRLSFKPSRGALYLMPNGEFLHISGGGHILADTWLKKHEFRLHSDNYIDSKGHVNDDVLTLEDRFGCIRINTDDKDYSYIVLRKDSVPTDSQYNSLLSLFDFMIAHNYSGVTLATSGWDRGHYFKLSDGITSDDMVKSVKRYYTSGFFESLNETKSNSTKKTLQTAYNDIGNNFNHPSSPEKGPMYIDNGGFFVSVDETHYDFWSMVYGDIYGDGDDDKIQSLMDSAEEDGMIRLNDGTSPYDDKAYIVLMKAPTQAQYEAIRKWFESLSKKSVMLYTYPDEDPRSDSFSLDILDPEHAVKSIKRYFASGFLEDLKEHKRIDTNKAISVLKSQFGASSEPESGSELLLPDGSFIWSTGTHSDLLFDLLDEMYGTEADEYDRYEAKDDLCDAGVIILNDGADEEDDGSGDPLCYCIINAKPTEAQYDSLSSWLFMLAAEGNGEVGVDLGNERHSSESTSDPNALIKSIRRYFVSGFTESKGGSRAPSEKFVGGREFNMPKGKLDYMAKDQYFKGYHMESVPLSRLIKDNSLDNPDELSYHAEWSKGEDENGNPAYDIKSFHYDPSKDSKDGDIIYGTERNGKLTLANGKHRVRALANDGYESIMMPVYRESYNGQGGNKTATRIYGALTQLGLETTVDGGYLGEGSDYADIYADGNGFHLHLRQVGPKYLQFREIENESKGNGMAGKAIDAVLACLDSSWQVEAHVNLNDSFWRHIRSQHPDFNWIGGGSPSLKESQEGKMLLVTYQSPLVAKSLSEGHEYIASYNNVFNKAYKKQYKNLSKYLGFKNCPIFAIRKEDEDKYSSESGALYGVDTKGNTRIELAVPSDEAKEVDYYGWSDYLYFSSGEEDDNELGLTSEQSLDNIQKYIGDSPEKGVDLQVVVDRIKPEWVVSDDSLKESDGDFDWGTGKAVGDDIFDTSTLGGFSYYADTIPGAKYHQYMIDEKNREGRIVQMSPNEYYQEVASRIFKGTSAALLKEQRSYPPEYMESLKKVITDRKEKFPMCFIDYADGGQEGLHRMYAAGELFGWDHRFPVLLIDWADPERHASDVKRRAARDAEDAIGKAIAEAVRLVGLRSLGEFADELKYRLPAGADVSFDEKNGEFTVTSNGASVTQGLQQVLDRLPKNESLSGGKYIAYHSTDADFKEFSKDYIGSGHGLSYGDGFYFSSEPIRGFAKRTIRCELTIGRPYEFDFADGEQAKAFLEKLGVGDDDIDSWLSYWGGNWKGTISKVLREERITSEQIRKRLGCDGLIIHNTNVDPRMDGHTVPVDTEYVVFEPSQIRILGEGVNESERRAVDWAKDKGMIGRAVEKRFGQDGLDGVERAFFIAPDGKYIRIMDLEGDHGNLFYWIEDEFGDIPHEGENFMSSAWDRLGYIRCGESGDPSYYIEFPSQVTERQWSSLTEWFDRGLGWVEEYQVDTPRSDGFAKMDVRGLSPDDIASRMKALAQGKAVRESAPESAKFPDSMTSLDAMLALKGEKE